MNNAPVRVTHDQWTRFTYFRLSRRVLLTNEHVTVSVNLRLCFSFSAEALERQRQMYERQMQMLRCQLTSPITPSMPYAFDPFSKIMTPSGSVPPTLHPRYQQWERDRYVVFRQLRSYLLICFSCNAYSCVENKNYSVVISLLKFVFSFNIACEGFSYFINYHELT